MHNNSKSTAKSTAFSVLYTELFHILGGMKNSYSTKLNLVYYEEKFQNFYVLERIFLCLRGYGYIHLQESIHQPLFREHENV